MKKVVYAILACLLCALLLGCSKEGNGTEAAGGAPDSMQLSPDGSDATNDANASRNMVFGKVESIVGNEVVLALGEADVPQGATREQNSQNAGGAMPESGMRPEGGAMPEGGARPAGGTRPEGGVSGAGGAGGRQSGNGSLRNVEITYTGETATYQIPVGLAVGAGDYSSITKGMVLQLTCNDEGDIMAVAILSQ